MLDGSFIPSGVQTLLKMRVIVVKAALMNDMTADRLMFGRTDLTAVKAGVTGRLPIALPALGFGMAQGSKNAVCAQLQRQYIMMRGPVTITVMGQSGRASA